MADPIIELRGVEKALGESFPLRIREFTLAPGERIALGGLSGARGEALMNLITGASLPEAGEVVVFGTNTRDVKTDTEWLHSLDRFGLVSNRAVLLDHATVAQNLALPLTLAIDPIPDDVRARVDALATEAGISPDWLDRRVDEVYGAGVQRMRLHLARAIAHDPQVLLLEHPTINHFGVASDLFGAAVRAIADARKLSMLVVTDDDRLARSSGARRFRVELDGTIKAAGFALQRFFFFGWGG